MKLTNLKITPKLGILVGVTLLGLCAAGVLAGYLMQREMLNARIDQTKAIVEMGLNLAAGLKKQVDAGEMTKEAALAELGRRANSMTYDKGAGYLFGTGYDGITMLAPDPKQIGTNRMDVVTNGRKLSQELMDGVKANGSILLTYEYVKPGEEKPIRKIGYAVAVPGFDMYLGTGAYLDDLDAKMKPIAWLLGLAILGIARDLRQHRLADRPQHLKAARRSSAPACRRWPTASSTAKFPASAAATRSARWRRPSRSSRTTRCASAGSNRPRPRPRRAPRPSAARRWRTSPAISNAASPASSARSRRRRPACRPPRSR